jgi:hypothetical protein
LVTLVLGVSAATALGWADQQGERGGDYGSGEKNSGSQDSWQDREGDHGRGREQGGHEGPKVKVPPPVPVRPEAQPPAPPVQPAEAPPEQLTEKAVPAEQPKPAPVADETPVTTEVATPIAPAAQRTELAETGFDPLLIALAGAACILGGALVFRRALARR